MPNASGVMFIWLQCFPHICVNISKCVFFSPKFKTSQDGLGDWYHSLIDAVTTWQGADNVECTIVIKLVLDQLSNKTSVDIDALINWSYFRNGLQKSIYCLQSSQISVSANFRLRKPRSKTRVWQLLAGVDIGHWSDNLWGQCQSWQSDGKYCWGWVAALVFGYFDIFNILIWNIWQSDGKQCLPNIVGGACEIFGYFKHFNFEYLAVRWQTLLRPQKSIGGIVRMVLDTNSCG